MKIYLDVCCLSRPFDDLTQDRVKLEANSVMSILSRCNNEEWTLVGSNVIERELSRIKNADKLTKIRSLYSIAREELKMSEPAARRAVFFQRNGIKLFDSMHLALAETSGVDAFLTTDDELLLAAGKIKLNIVAGNPVMWLMEAMRNERQRCDRFS